MNSNISRLKRKAFTMIELVMVIVILGIVGMIGSDIIVKMYQGYIKSKIVNDLEQKTELLLEEISKRLKYRIKETTIARDSGTDKYLILNSQDISLLNPDMVEWIGYNYEGLIGESNGVYSIPGWSGFIDVNSTQTTKSAVFTRGSDLRIADKFIDTLSSGNVKLNSNFTTDHPVLIPKCQKDSNLAMYGWDIPNVSMPMDNNNTFIVRQNSGDNDHLYFKYTTSKPICEQYYLAWSAYALVPVGNNKDDFNLTLKYSYQPWEGENYKDKNTKSSLLAEHLSTFKVLQIGDSIRIKVCIHDNNSTGIMYGFCKEKAVF